MTRRDAAAVAAAGTVLGLLGASRAAPWHDEAATLVMTRRSPGGVVDVLGGIDAVHGLYYGVGRIWLWLTGGLVDPLVALRGFSALGAGVAAGATVLLVARFAPRGVAVGAGAATALAPGLAWSAVEARSYGWGAALAVLGTIALLDALERPGRAGWVRYAALALLGVWWHLHLALLVLAHGVAVAAVRSRGLRAWAFAAGVVAAGVLPLVVLAARQREQVAWLDAPLEALPRRVGLQFVRGGHGLGPDGPGTLAWALAAAALVLAVSGLVALWREGGRLPAAVLAAWAAFPTAVLVVGVLVGVDLYHPRYVSFSVPALAVAVVLGIRALATRSRVAGVVVAAALLAMTVPVHLAQRSPDAKPHDLEAMADVARRTAPDSFYLAADPARSLLVADPGAFAGLPRLALPTEDDHPSVFDPGDGVPLDAERVRGRRVLVYDWRGWSDDGLLLLDDLGCRTRTVARSGSLRARIYRCPDVSPAAR